jgi:hypothetical protein
MVRGVKHGIFMRVVMSPWEEVKRKMEEVGRNLEKAEGGLRKWKDPRRKSQPTTITITNNTLSSPFHVAMAMVIGSPAGIASEQCSGVGASAWTADGHLWAAVAVAAAKQEKNATRHEWKEGKEG